jgi:hypothetical protein
MPYSTKVNPVTLPPGRARLATPSFRVEASPIDVRNVDEIERAIRGAREIRIAYRHAGQRRFRVDLKAKDTAARF